MIKLYGLRFSNYYSLTKALLIEKGLEFEEVKAPPSQDDEWSDATIPPAAISWSRFWIPPHTPAQMSNLYNQAPAVALWLADHDVEPTVPAGEMVRIHSLLNEARALAR